MDTNIWFMATVDGTIVNENEKKIPVCTEIFSCSLQLTHVEEISRDCSYKYGCNTDKLTLHKCMSNLQQSKECIH